MYLPNFMLLPHSVNSVLVYYICIIYIVFMSFFTQLKISFDTIVYILKCNFHTAHYLFSNHLADFLFDSYKHIYYPRYFFF